MEPIAKLLFAATLVAFFSYVLIFWSFGYAGKGGEYWGFDRNVDGAAAALTAFEQGDYRFLSVRIRDPGGRKVWYVPAVVECSDNPYGERAYSRQSSSEPLHGDDSFAVADGFARSYNRALAWHLASQRNVRCEVLPDE